MITDIDSTNTSCAILIEINGTQMLVYPKDLTNKKRKSDDEWVKKEENKEPEKVIGLGTELSQELHEKLALMRKAKNIEKPCEGVEDTPTFKPYPYNKAERFIISIGHDYYFKSFYKTWGYRDMGMQECIIKCTIIDFIQL